EFFDLLVCRVERGVVDQNVEPAEACDGLFDQFAAMLLVLDVARHGQGLAAGFLYPADGLVGVALFLLEKRDSNVGSFARKRDRHRAADAAVAAGDERGLARQPIVAPVRFLAVVRLIPHLLLGRGRLLSRFLEWRFFVFLFWIYFCGLCHLSPYCFASSVVRMIRFGGSNRGARFRTPSCLLLPRDFRPLALLDRLAARPGPLASVRNARWAPLPSAIRAGAGSHRAAGRRLLFLYAHSGALYLSWHMLRTRSGPAAAHLLRSFIYVAVWLADHLIGRFFSECAVGLRVPPANGIRFPAGTATSRFSAHGSSFRSKKSQSGCRRGIANRIAARAPLCRSGDPARATSLLPHSRYEGLGHAPGGPASEEQCCRESVPVRPYLADERRESRLADPDQFRRESSRSARWIHPPNCGTNRAMKPPPGCCPISVSAAGADSRPVNSIPSAAGPRRKPTAGRPRPCLSSQRYV